MTQSDDVKISEDRRDALRYALALGGGAALTQFGARLIDQYRKIEAKAHSTNAARLRELEAACRGAQEAATTKSHASLRRRTIAR